MDFAALRRLWPLAAVAVLLALTAVAAANSTLPVSRTDTTTERELPALPDYQQPQAIPTDEPPEDFAAAEQQSVPSWVPLAAGVLCGVAVLVVVGLLLWTLLRDLTRRRSRAASGRIRRRAQPSGPASAAEVVAAVDAGLVELSDADADPRRAVIACWVRLEQAAAAAGTPRQIGDTSTDLVTRLLAGHAISAEVLSAFAAVYRQARYARHAVDERTRAQAQSALRRLRGELTASVGATDGRPGDE
ncbi:DUF4129 domain-containing protein [Micromonospora sp. NBC_01813]|uniref:DUF4129 domain-containing protein n=1 Tax=Micromonospora sp. NBC_01813 TaxID=2975988 RepID=UPI002DDA2DFF|nr:DUF4129 domain-containing protein [Micromonospora sp. NBC_01813]WSA08349.1 DUF4129 domain-containing protein [Micromonospora sp. NBC_01813]